MVELAVLQGCIHGEIDRCYEAAQQLESDVRGGEVKLVIWAGDCQTLRGSEDLEGLACPPKYRRIGEFPKYYNGETIAPFLTLFAGGNHEASFFLQSLPFGGWVAPNIFYIGRTAVLNFGKQRIAGLSGIYNHHDYTKGFWEAPPMNENTIRSCYHVRYYDVAKLNKVERKVNLILTHDWPTEIVQKEADRQSLIRKKPFFQKELMNHELGNPNTNVLLRGMQPDLWVGAHFHVTFTCDYDHDIKVTKFVAHDKPKRVVSQSAWNLETGRCYFDCYPGWTEQYPELAFPAGVTSERFAETAASTDLPLAAANVISSDTLEDQGPRAVQPLKIIATSDVTSRPVEQAQTTMGEDCEPAAPAMVCETTGASVEIDEAFTSKGAAMEAKDTRPAENMAETAKAKDTVTKPEDPLSPSLPHRHLVTGVANVASPGTQVGDDSHNTQAVKRRRLSDSISVDLPAFRRSPLELDLEWLCILKRSIPKLPTHRGPTSGIEISVDGGTTWRTAFEVAGSVDEKLDANWKAQLQPYFNGIVDAAETMAASTEAEGVTESAKKIALDHTIGVEVPLHKIRVAIPDWTVLKPAEPEKQTRWWIELVGEDPDVWLPVKVITEANEEASLQFGQPGFSQQSNTRYPRPGGRRYYSQGPPHDSHQQRPLPHPAQLTLPRVQQLGSSLTSAGPPVELPIVGLVDPFRLTAVKPMPDPPQTIAETSLGGCAPSGALPGPSD